jgi:glucose/arabinose dehydrogenase/plastocyanin
MRIFLPIIFSIFVLFFYTLPDVNADSEFSVSNTKGSYNLGCELDNSCFEPYIANILVGDTVTWTNNDDAIHVVVSGAPNSESFKDFEDGEFFDSGFLKSNETFSHKFLEEGIFGYFCTLHPWMNGFVIVGDVEFIEPSMDADFETLPIVLDSDFKIEDFASGLFVPVNMEFVGEDLLVLEKNSGTVRHIKDNVLLDSPVLDVEVSNYGEHGLLGITSVENNVFLFFTEAYHDGGRALENRIYQYSWDGTNLVNPILLKTIPGFEREYVGGEMVSDLSGNVFAVTGENYKIGLLQNTPQNESYRHFSSVASTEEKNKRTISHSFEHLLSCSKVSFQQYTTNPFGWQSEQPDLSENPPETNLFNILGNLNSCLRQFYYENFSDGHWEDTSAIIQIQPEGEYAAIGIRNSFGLAVDPQTGFMWDTENGPDVFDEINLIDEKFNSGWAKIQGPSNGKSLPVIPEYSEYIYSEPEFSWEIPIGVTAIEFPNSNDFEKYGNFLFVADTNKGIIYKFKLDETRTKFIFESPHLQDLVLNMLPDSSGNEPMDEIIFAKNLGLISDMKFGPDGALYVISLMEGKIYKISS